jgi:hypothetical protein
MAGRILNRRELRKQADQADQAEVVAPEGEAEADEKPSAKPKKAAKAKVKRAPRAKKAPPRMRARWGVFDSGMKQVAVFDYNQRAAADEKLAALLAKAKGLHFVQLVKEPMPEPEPGEPPA